MAVHWISKASYEPQSSFGWMPRFHRLTGDYERLIETLEGPRNVAFGFLMFRKPAPQFYRGS
jgi:hypothetical protein